MQIRLRKKNYEKAEAGALSYHTTMTVESQDTRRYSTLPYGTTAASDSALTVHPAPGARGPAARLSELAGNSGNRSDWPRRSGQLSLSDTETESHEILYHQLRFSSFFSQDLLCSARKNCVTFEKKALRGYISRHLKGLSQLLDNLRRFVLHV
eukprot:756883-Hanusia_phi.AAC.2